MTETPSDISRHMSGIIQSPDGVIQYYSTPKIKDKHNPYIKKSILHDEELGQEYIEVESNGEHTILADNINNALELECNAMVVRFLCLLDFIINIIYLLNSYYIIGFFIATISMSGYFSTITYNKQGLIGYIIYQYILSLSKILLTATYIGSFASHKYKFIIQLEKDYLIVLNPTTQIIFFLSISSLVQIYITYFIHRFYNKLKIISIEYY